MENDAQKDCLSDPRETLDDKKKTKEPETEKDIEPTDRTMDSHGGRERAMRRDETVVDERKPVAFAK